VQAGAEKVTRAMRALEAAYLIGVEGATEIWLVRHGDCYEGMVDGDLDPGLSKLGRAQAQRLAERVRPLKPHAVYASPFKRAVETARSFADDVHTDQRLLEIPLEFGDDGSFEFTEKPEDVTARMTAFIDEIVARHPGERVIVVGHAGAIVNYLCSVMRLEPGQLRILPFYTSVSVVRALGDRRMVGALCDASHLDQ
jgi:2,3-bisphosphoglycerate-dependent phosphoglycerate mutase